MKLIDVATEDLTVSNDLTRTGSAKAFSERLQASIDEIGLAEPIKVAPLPKGGYLVIDGGLRLQAIRALRKADPMRFRTIPAYLYDYEQRFEIRYQSDIYQDLLPSQLAQLVEHLHEAEHVKKLDIARYIGVSPATLRNYTRPCTDDPTRRPVCKSSGFDGCGGFPFIQPIRMAPVVGKGHPPGL